MAPQPPSPEDFEPSFRHGLQWSSKNSFLRVGSLSLVTTVDNYKNTFEANETTVGATEFVYHEQAVDSVGPYTSLNFSDINEEFRFFWMDPQYDNATSTPSSYYEYKLYSASVSSAEATTITTTTSAAAAAPTTITTTTTTAINGFYYWNAYNNETSELIIPKVRKGDEKDKYHGIQCDYMEFNFEGMMKDTDSPPEEVPFKHLAATLKMSDVEIGLFSSNETNDDGQEQPINLDSLRLYKPCRHRKCIAVDGKLSCGAWESWVLYLFLTFLVVLSTMLGCLLGCYCTKQGTVRYQQLSMSDDDDLEQEEKNGGGGMIELHQHQSRE